MIAAEILVDKCLKIEPGEKVLIVTDKKTESVAEAMSVQVEKAGANPFVYILEEYKRPLKQIPTALKDMLSGITAGMTPFKAIPAEGTFRFDLVKTMASCGARVAHMPGITLDILKNIDSGNIDYDIIEKNALTVSSALENAKNIRIKAENGTDITFDISGRRIIKEGCIIPKGDIFNFPSGEVFISPLESSANGIFVCDTSTGNAGMVDASIRLTFANGKLKDIKSTGQTKETIIKDIKEATGGKDMLSEFGIGINPFFRPIGNALIDEKILGTCHIAVGDNTGLGGINKSSIHIDFIMDKPTIIIDDKKILMTEGELNV